MRELRRIIATCRKFRQVVVVRFFRTTTNVSQFATQCLKNQVIRNFRTTQKLQHWVRNAYFFPENEIVYALRTQLRYITRILKWSYLTTLNPSISMGLKKEINLKNRILWQNW